MKKYGIAFCTLFFNSLALAANLEPACPEFPFFEPKTGALAVTNCDFHHSYEARVKQIESTFGAVNGRPVIMNLGGTLIFKYNGKTETATVTPPAYHNIKAYGHTVFTVYLLLSQNEPGALNTKTIAQLEKLKTDLQQSLLLLQSLDLTFETKRIISKMENVTEDFLNTVLKDKHWSKRELKHYYQEISPLLNQTIMIVAKIELQTLDKTINQWLAQMQPHEIKKLGLVDAMPHQPRAQEISLQYFAKKFGLRFGEGAMHETALVVLENQYDEKSASTLLARHYLDREAAQMIFNDAEKLQRDLLADAAKEILSHQD